VRRGSPSVSRLGRERCLQGGVSASRKKKEKKGGYPLAFGAREGARRVHSLAFEARMEVGGEKESPRGCT